MIFFISIQDYFVYIIKTNNKLQDHTTEPPTDNPPTRSNIDIIIIEFHNVE